MNPANQDPLLARRIPGKPGRGSSGVFVCGRGERVPASLQFRARVTIVGLFPLLSLSPFISLLVSPAQGEGMSSPVVAKGEAVDSGGAPVSDGEGGYYDSLLDRMRERHPALVAEKMKSAASGMAARSSRLAYPDPEISVARSSANSKTSMYFMTPKYLVESGEGIDYRLTQPIPFPGKLTLQSKAALIDGDLGRLRYYIETNNLAGRFLKNLIEARRLRETLEETRMFVERVAILSDVAEMRYRTDRGSLADLSRGKLKVSQYRERIQDLEGRLDAKKRELRYYLEDAGKGNETAGAGEGSGEGPGKPEEESASGVNGIEKGRMVRSESDAAVERLLSGEDFAPFMERMLARSSLPSHPVGSPADLSLEAKASDLEEKRREYMQDSARMDFLPDFAVFAGYGRTDRRGDYTDVTRGHEETYSLGLTVRIPLWSAFSNTYKLKEQNRMQSAARMANVDVRERVDSLYDAAMRSLESNRDRIDLYDRSLIPAARITSDSSKLAYEAGRVDFSALLESYDSLYQARVDWIRLHSDYYSDILTLAGLVDRIYRGDGEADRPAQRGPQS